MRACRYWARRAPSHQLHPGHELDGGHQLGRFPGEGGGAGTVRFLQQGDGAGLEGPEGVVEVRPEHGVDGEVKAGVAGIPPDRRRVITTHDAFGYFAAAYGVAFIAPQGVSTEAEVSARDVAKIITQIRKQKIPAVFIENVTDPRLVKRIAEETGAKIGGTLYSDALTDASGTAPTYIDMVRHNIRALGDALIS